jgi:predicted alpha/beta hydrolase family esterase
MSAPTVLLLPGLGNSGARHWQTLWELRYGYTRVIQHDWDRPERDLWVAAIDDAVQDARAPVVLVAHSLACAAVAHWARRPLARKIAAALLVAPADVDSPTHMPPETRSFAPLPLDPLPFAAVVVASDSDPYVDLERARQFAESWSAEWVTIGDVGHINADSGLGDWPEGHRLLERLVARVG